MDSSATALMTMVQRAGTAAALMKALSSEHRLLIMCHLAEAGELSVGTLVERIGLSQSALSQHLARLRQEGLVGFRREAQTLFYRISDPRAEQVLQFLYDIFCTDVADVTSGQSPMAAAAAEADHSRKETNDGRRT